MMVDFIWTSQYRQSLPVNFRKEGFMDEEPSSLKLLRSFSSLCMYGIKGILIWEANALNFMMPAVPPVQTGLIICWKMSLLAWVEDLDDYVTI
jgi:hypothetical protein